jgi:hypothetical protein
MYQIPKCTSLLQLNVDKKIIGGEFTFEEGTQYKIKTDQACKYLVLKFDTNKIKNSDVKLYAINWYNHKHFYEIKDNKFIVGPRYMYDKTLKTYKKVNIVKYLYRLSGKYQDNFWSRSPVKIDFGTKTANG